MKHYIITRFLCVDFGYGDKIFSEEFIHNGCEYMRRYFIPTLKNQTNQNFEVIAKIHDDIDLEKLKELTELSKTCGLKMHIVRNSKSNKFIESSLKKGEIIITTRMDYDDGVRNDAVDIIQKLAKKELKNGQCAIWHGYLNGCTMIENEQPKTFANMSVNYGGNGAWSIFQSFAYIYNGIMKSIYDLGNHTKILDGIENVLKELNFNVHETIFIRNSDVLSYLWVRHENTGSHKSEHRTHQYLDIDNEKIYKRFGIKVE